MMRLQKPFCFACRVCLIETGTNYKRDAFSTDGYLNWKKATDKGKGFTQHCNSISHIGAMKLYSEHLERQKKGEEVDIQVQKHVPEHREWVEAVFDVILFLTLNGLPLRGIMKTLILIRIPQKVGYL